jgi:hypothetical protein
MLRNQADGPGSGASVAKAQPIQFVPNLSLRSKSKLPARERTVLRLPSYEEVKSDPILYAHANRVLHLETNPGNARAGAGPRRGTTARDVWMNPPPIPLTTAEMDWVFGLPYARSPHPAYADESGSRGRDQDSGLGDDSHLGEHHARLLRRLHLLLHHRARGPHHPEPLGRFHHPGARRDPRQGQGLYRHHLRPGRAHGQYVPPGLQEPADRSGLPQAQLRLPRHLPEPAHRPRPLIKIYRRARKLPGIKKILIGSGLRYDLAVKSPEYVKELVQHHVGGYLKIAPEHTEQGPLTKMMKPGIGSYDKFKQLFEKFSEEAGKKQFLIPYFIAAHPGTSDEDMMNLAIWLKKNGFRADQVQTFYPSPMATATAMYHSGRNTLTKVRRQMRDEAEERVDIVRGEKRRRLHKAFLRYHDPNNWPLLREALKTMGRADLIGNGKQHLIPTFQPLVDGSYQSARKKNSTSSKAVAASATPPTRMARPWPCDAAAKRRAWSPRAMCAFAAASPNRASC